MLSVASGYSPEYLLKEVATGRENYYTGAVAEGEPPGRWWGAGAEKLGLTGLVEAQDMRAVYERYLDPRADGFREPERWDEVDTLDPGDFSGIYFHSDQSGIGRLHIGENVLADVEPENLIRRLQDDRVVDYLRAGQPLRVLTERTAVVP